MVPDKAVTVTPGRLGRWNCRTMVRIARRSNADGRARGLPRHQGAPDANVRLTVDLLKWITKPLPPDAAQRATGCLLDASQ
ncbi:MAG: hypothetical protein J2P48_09700 [Alphaproteobacteria bacterium]|nr:hypothetical protein [Alphaproteobacteria bacterium]